MIEHKLKRVELDDPRRCLTIAKGGPCPYMSMEGHDPEEYKGIKHCQRHGGLGEKRKLDKKQAHTYRLQVWQERLTEFAEDTKIKSLREEIGVLRLVLETILNRCESSTDLLIYTSQISDLATKIERLVLSADKLESKMGMLLDKSAALNFAGQVVEIISQYVHDPETIDQISTGIIDALSSYTKT